MRGFYTFPRIKEQIEKSKRRVKKQGIHQVVYLILILIIAYSFTCLLISYRILVFLVALFVILYTTLFTLRVTLSNLPLCALPPPLPPRGWGGEGGKMNYNTCTYPLGTRCALKLSLSLSFLYLSSITLTIICNSKYTLNFITTTI